MTVNTTNITSGPYPGNGVTTQFAYTFRVENKNQLIVYETDGEGAIVTLTVDTDYTVTGISTDGGGTLTRVAGALPSGYTWYVRSDYDETQLTSFSSQGAFFPEVHEAAMDKTTFLIQQLNDQMGRTAKFADNYSGAGTAILPTPIAGSMLQWNSTATGFDNISIDTVVIVGSISEEQTANSNGQALFTLASVTYAPGTKNITVSRNGVRLRYSSFTQTSASSITLSATEATSVAIGDEFEFIVNERSVSADVIAASSVTFTPTGVGAVTDSAQDKMARRKDVEDFGAVGDGALSGANPVGTGTGTDDSAAIQLAFDWVRDTGGVLHFDGTKVYLCDSVLTLLRTSNTGPTRYIINFNGTALDFSNLAVGDYLTVGADSLANIATDGGLMYLGRGFIYGQQAGNPGLIATASTNTATTGLATQWCYNLQMEQMSTPRCYRGLRPFYTFPILDLQSSFKNCIAGISFNDVTNRGTWVGTETPQCRFGLVTELDGTADSGKCVNHTFIGLRTEGSAIGMHLDPGSNNAGIGVLKGLKFIDPYSSGSTHDAIRLGTVLDLENPATTGADSTDRIYNFDYDAHSSFFGLTPASGNVAIRFSGNNNVRQAEISIPVDISTANTIVNTPRNSDIHCWAQPDATSDISKTTYRYGSSGALYETNATETVLVVGTVSPSGITYLSGASGAYTATLADGTVDGQQKRVLMSEASNTVTLSVTSHETGNPTTFAFSNVQHMIVLEWFNQDWHTVISRGV